MSSLPSANLSEALKWGSLALSKTLSGACSLEKALAEISDDPVLYGATQSLIMPTLRQLGFVRFVLNRLVKQKIKENKVESLILLALTDLLGSHHQYPEYVLVHQAVTAVTYIIPKHQRSLIIVMQRLVNAVLRAALRQKEQLISERLFHDEAYWNFPSWWIDKLKLAYPNHWQQILGVAQQPPPLIIRINQIRISISEYVQLLEKNSFSCVKLSPVQAGMDSDALLLEGIRNVTDLPGYVEGYFAVQDSAAQCAAHLLPVKAQDRVLDACAAPGGKTTHLLNRFPNIHLLAIDVSPKRLERIRLNLARERVNAQVKCGAAQNPQVWWDGQLFDHILIDAPCSASGIVRRHPEIRWLRSQEEIRRLVQEQVEILDALWPLLKIGGTLLFVTCSIFPEEGEEQAEYFLARHNNALRLQSLGQLLPTDHCADNALDGLRTVHDGFFYAHFKKI